MLGKINTVCMSYTAKTQHQRKRTVNDMHILNVQTTQTNRRCISCIMFTPANFIAMPSTVFVVNALVACLSHRNIDQFATNCCVSRQEVFMVRVWYVYGTCMGRVWYVYGTCAVPNSCYHLMVCWFSYVYRSCMFIYIKYTIHTLL